MKTTLRLYEPAQAHKALLQLWVDLKPWLIAEHRFELQLRPERRSPSQSAKFHAMCEDAAQAKLEWAGKPRNKQQWKVLLISGHSVATKEMVEIVPGIEGEFVNIRESSALMSRGRGSSLIDYTIAFLVSRGVLNPEESA